MINLIEIGKNLSLQLQKLVDKKLLTSDEINDFNKILLKLSETNDLFKKSNSNIVDFEKLIMQLTNEMNYTKNDILKQILFSCKEYIISNSEWYQQNEINITNQLIFYKAFYDNNYNFISAYNQMRIELYNYSLLTTMQNSQQFNTDFKTDLTQFEFLFNLQYPEI